ncbi:uncharacterized protein [Macrobrachium rosenbergii]|uniref:uncharacterized protein n=1 Tax=Macrobrachium rosenbergii TaxID=79674 RepID=UPI0034D58A7E
MYLVIMPTLIVRLDARSSTSARTGPMDAVSRTPSSAPTAPSSTNSTSSVTGGSTSTVLTLKTSTQSTSRLGSLPMTHMAQRSRHSSPIVAADRRPRMIWSTSCSSKQQTTSFSCDAQNVPGYCADTDRQAGCRSSTSARTGPMDAVSRTFLCPNGTIFQPTVPRLTGGSTSTVLTLEDFYSVNEQIGVVAYDLMEVAAVTAMATATMAMVQIAMPTVTIAMVQMLNGNGNALQPCGRRQAQAMDMSTSSSPSNENVPGYYADTDRQAGCQVFTSARTGPMDAVSRTPSSAPTAPSSTNSTSSVTGGSTDLRR